MSLFARLRHRGEAEHATKTKLLLWLPDYLKEIERQHGIEHDRLQLPKSFEVADDPKKWPESQLPCLIIASPGTVDGPARDGDGVHAARYRLNIGVLISSSSEEDTRLLAQLYGAAIRGVLLQHRDLDDGITIVEWLGDAEADTDGLASADARRTLAIEMNGFTVEIEQIINDSQGPLVPDLPPADWPDVGTVTVDVQPKET